MAISLDKILTMSAKEWINLEGEQLTRYTPKGVHVRGNIKEFAEAVPSNASVVVSYRFFEIKGEEPNYCSSGVALIPQSRV